ncbi:HNH endonuclease signature motif containing protein [Paenarthrobacter ilicis]|uniref:HNH nuclease domain-containing protein n=2 Tax=Paenarthrobacter ilicis TaxID=43665 RepID=A0ABX0TJ57_9MICC|nr:hypothetical protein [Paenarthrobacter ilicis]NIJ00782.1 hypothetical protein [Paenarthrobacter ilicis]
MLRTAENVSLYHQPGFWTGKGPAILTVGRNSYRLSKFSKQEFADIQVRQMNQPVAITSIGERRYWQFQHRFYWENEGLRSGEIRALLVVKNQRRQQQIDRAQATVAMGAQPRGASARRAIPDDVKQYVWTRDEGQCRACGSTGELQYDHVIPISMGGSNNVENLQILCGPCNRRKSAGLTTRH